MDTSDSAESDERCSVSGKSPRDTDSMFHLLFERTAAPSGCSIPAATVVGCNKAAMRCESRAMGRRDRRPTRRSTASGKLERLVAFVAGPEASYITGANLTVDGGTNA